MVLSMCASRTMRRWRLLIKPDKVTELERLVVKLEKRGADPRTTRSNSTSSSLGASRSLQHLLASRGGGGGQGNVHDSTGGVTERVPSYLFGMNLSTSLE